MSPGRKKGEEASNLNKSGVDKRSNVNLTSISKFTFCSALGVIIMEYSAHRYASSPPPSCAINAFQLIDTVPQQIRCLMRQFPSGETKTLPQYEQQAQTPVFALDSF